jgi:hypothetical protein
MHVYEAPLDPISQPPTADLIFDPFPARGLLQAQGPDSAKKNQSAVQHPENFTPTPKSEFV